jgi:DNA-directed RNA polymerase subunit omega
MSWKTYYGENGSGLRYPPINLMISKADNKYELCVATSKRARQLIDGAEPLVRINIDNPISTATEEIAEDEVKIIGLNAQKAQQEKAQSDDDKFAAAQKNEGFSLEDLANGDDIILE